jgi:hypothetical protein
LRIGGYYAGFRIAFDTLLTNLLLMSSRRSHVPLPLYHCRKHAASLTQSPQTGMGSALRAAAWDLLKEMYARAFVQYEAFLAGRVSAVQLTRRIRCIIRGHVSSSDQAAIRLETARLRSALHSRGGAYWVVPNHQGTGLLLDRNKARLPALR